MSFIKKNSFVFGFIMGLLLPVGGLFIYRYRNLSVLSTKEAFQYLVYQPSHTLLAVALSISLLLNAIMFTFYINAHIDKTAKGIFAATLIYGLTILCIKTLF